MAADANLQSARGVADLLAKAGVDITALAHAAQRTAGYSATLDAFLQASAAGGDPKAMAGALMKRLLGAPDFFKAYRSAGENGPEGKAILALMKVISR